jgi:hypothetical protein
MATPEFQFHYDRIIWDIKGAGKVLCMSCVDSERAYTPAGLKQHAQVFHIGLDWQKQLEECKEGTKRLALQETRSMLSQLSSFNQVGVKFDLYIYPHRSIGSNDNIKYVLLSSQCLILTDKKSLSKHHNSF